MKINNIFAIIAALTFGLTACGGTTDSGSSFWDPNNIATDLTGSIEAMGTMLDYTSTMIDVCFSVSPDTIRCDCPYGGTVTLTEGVNDTGTFTFENCVDGNYQVFGGEVTYDGDLITFNLNRAAACRSVTNTANSAECSGTLEAICEGVTTTCTFQGSEGNCSCQ